MIEKNIIKYETEDDIKQHSSIKSVEIIDGKLNFPISWFKNYETCPYQIYVKGIETPKISHGSQIQNQLDDIFKQEADKISFKDAIELSKKEDLMSRQCFLLSKDLGIRGEVDEIWMKNDEIVIINDAQGRTPYDSTMNISRASSLAFKDMFDDERKIKSALRERGTQNLFWIEVFTDEIEKNIKDKVMQIHRLIDTKEFKATADFKECEKCKFKNKCEYSK